MAIQISRDITVDIYVLPSLELISKDQITLSHKANLIQVKPIQSHFWPILGFHCYVTHDTDWGGTFNFIIYLIKFKLATEHVGVTRRRSKLQSLLWVTSGLFVRVGFNFATLAFQNHRLGFNVIV